MRTLAVAAFKAIDGAGMARVDFLLAGDSGNALPQRVNTIPGSRPSACTRRCGRRAASPIPALLDRLIALALERHAEKQQLRTSM